MIDAEVCDVLVKLGPELMPVVSANSVDAERELADEVIDKLDGILLVVPVINFERANARR